MDINLQIQQMQEQISRIQSDLNDLSAKYNKNNFTSHQDFTKSCTFTTKLKIPVYTTLPSCEPGEIVAYSTGGTYKLMVATAVDTFTIVGTQS